MNSSVSMRESKYFIRKYPPHHPSYWIAEGEILFLTICSAHRETRPLTQPGVPAKILQAARHYHDLGRWHLRLFLIMPDHVHGLAAIPRTETLRKVMASWKSYVAKQTGITWQRDFFDHRPRDWPAVLEKEKYILENPVRAKLVEKAENWPWVLLQGDLAKNPES